MEPRKETYFPFLKPLLDAPGSRYHYRDWDSGYWQPRTFVTEGLLPDLRQSDCTSREPAGRNDSILIVANVSTSVEKQKSRYSRVYESHKMMLRFIETIRAGSGFHAHGPVRMLLWVTEMEKQAILPRTVHHRRKISLALETTCRVEEIVGGSPSVRGKISSREDFLNVESGKQVAERMRRQNIQIPLERQDEMQRRVQDMLKGLPGNDAITVNDSGGTRADTSREWHKQLRQLRADFESGKLSRCIGDPPGLQTTPKKRKDGRVHSPEWRKMKEMERTLKSQQRKQSNTINLVLEQEQLDSLELEIYQEGLSEVERQQKLEKLDQRIHEFKTQLNTLTIHDSNRFKFTLDNRRAFAQDPPLLMWDQRTAEPLLARGDEFYKPMDMSLLDIQPRFPNPYPMTMEQAAYFKTIMSTVFTHGSSTLTSLKQLAPGAIEALVPRVPALQDPTKGGCRSPENLRARVMTPEMAYGLALAWDKWPFKPPLARAMTLSVTGAYPAPTVSST